MIHDQDPIEVLAENLFGLGLDIFRDTLLKKKYEKSKIQYKPKQFNIDPIENWEYYKCQEALAMPGGKIMISVAKKIDEAVRDKVLQKSEDLRMNVVGDLQSSKMSEKKKEYIWKAVDATTKKIDEIFSYTK